ncbi:Protein kinase domain, partial [Dillenia turbinata]
LIGATTFASKSGDSRTGCIVLEHLRGGSLRSYLNKNCKTKLPFNVVLELALDLAKGLSFLHSKKIVHRDVKLDNLLLDGNGTLKIPDFGFDRLEALNAQDMTGETGTPSYMAPEVIDCKPYDRKCDVYTKYQQSELLELRDLRPKIPQCCPTSLVELINRCWDADSKIRPEMEEVVSILKGIDTAESKGKTPAGKPRGCLFFISSSLQRGDSEKSHSKAQAITPSTPQYRNNSYAYRSKATTDLSCIHPLLL